MPTADTSVAWRRLWLFAALFGLIGFTAAGGLPCALLTAQPACSVIVSPGPTPDVLSAVTVTGDNSFPLAADSSLLMATISVNERVTWRSYVAARRQGPDDVPPRTTVFPPGESRADTQARNVAAMRLSQRSAEQAAYRHVFGGSEPVAIGVEIVAHTQASQLGAFAPGTIINRLNGVPVTSVAMLTDRLNRLAPDTAVEIGVTGGRSTTINVNHGDTLGALGVYVADAVALPFDVTVDTGVVGGPSAGLLFGIAIVEQLTDARLIPGLAVSGTGTLDATGQVGAVGGVKQKLFQAGALDSPVDVFLLPVQNVHELARVQVERDLLVVPVASLGDALQALNVLSHGGTPDSAVMLRP